MWNPVGVRIDFGQPPGVRRDAATPGYVVKPVPGKSHGITILTPTGSHITLSTATFLLPTVGRFHQSFLNVERVIRQPLAENEPLIFRKTINPIQQPFGEFIPLHQHDRGIGFAGHNCWAKVGPFCWKELPPKADRQLMRQADFGHLLALRSRQAAKSFPAERTYAKFTRRLRRRSKMQKPKTQRVKVKKGKGLFPPPPPVPPTGKTHHRQHPRRRFRYGYGG